MSIQVETSRSKTDREDYVDSIFEWSFLEATDHVKGLIKHDFDHTQMKNDLQKPVSFHRMSQELKSSPSWAVQKKFKKASKSSVNESDIDMADTAHALSSKWSFDIFEMSYTTNGHPMQALSYHIFTDHGLLQTFSLTETQFMRFIMQVERHYKRNPYHNAIHATDVMQTVNSIITGTGFINIMKPLETFCIFITSLVHDIEHTGTNNNFHKNSGSDLAKLYVVSVLENHHLRVGLRMMREFGILHSLSDASYEEFKAMLISMILATDMASHFLLITNMKLLICSPVRCQSRIRIMRIMTLILHCADISNPAKPWDIHKVWVSLLCQEFFSQGDKEREMKLPVSPNCDRFSANIATSQIGFMQTFTKETFDVMDSLLEKEIVFYNCEYTGYKPWQHEMKTNVAKWNGKWKFIKYSQFDELLSETANTRLSLTPKLHFITNFPREDKKKGHCAKLCDCLPCKCRRRRSSSSLSVT